MRFAEPYLYTISELGITHALLRGSQVAMATTSPRIVAAQQVAQEIRERKGWIVRPTMATMATWRQPSKCL